MAYPVPPYPVPPYPGVPYPKPPLPPEARGWNWGAFLLNWVWGIGNGTFIALLMFVPLVNLVMPFVLGAKGNEWAWRNANWDSVPHFRRVQRLWAIWGVVVWIGSAVAIAGGVYALTALLRNSEAYQLAVRQLGSDARVAASLGQPISTGFPMGSVNISGPSGNAELSFSASGPKASGTVYVVARKSEGRWELRRLRVELEGSGEVIVLVPSDYTSTGCGASCGAWNRRS